MQSCATIQTTTDVLNGFDADRRNVKNNMIMSDLRFDLHHCRTRAETPRAEAEALLVDHVTLMHERMIASGGPDFQIRDHVDMFWEKLDTVLYPNGSYYLARDRNGRFVGTGAMRRISPTAGEMKHLYVRPEARGMGLGRLLVQKRMEDARAMGLSTLYADTFAVNPEIRALYKSLGFQTIPQSADSASASISPELVPHMIFFRYDFPE